MKEALGHVRLRHEVDLEELGLQMTFVRKVALKRFKKEGCSFANSRVLYEDLKDALYGSLGNTIRVSSSDHFSKVACSLGVNWDH